MFFNTRIMFLIVMEFKITPDTGADPGFFLEGVHSSLALLPHQ